MEDCWKNASDLRDQKIYAQPPRKEECPICMIPLPCMDDESSYMPCCGKTLCKGCRYSLNRDCCPFCNTTVAGSHKESIKRLSDRMEKYSDPIAMVLLGSFYQHGRHGLPVDKSKAFELYKNASELEFECAGAHLHLGMAYQEGAGTEINMILAYHHYQIAAMMGNMAARNNVACFEGGNGNYQGAMRHFMIAAKCGNEHSLHNVKLGFKDGYVTKEDFANALRGYQAACDETKSEQREKAAAIIARERARTSHDYFS
eukprot:scaffold49403_cov23-Cyclotella_meneghiniana.AAC.1